jgi:tetratricopeptide (TPR) repeat protein
VDERGVDAELLAERFELDPAADGGVRGGGDVRGTTRGGDGVDGLRGALRELTHVETLPGASELLLKRAQRQQAPQLADGQRAPAGQHGVLFGQAMLPAVNSRLLLARCLADLGNVAEGCASAAEGLELARTADHPPTVAHACRGFGWAHLRVGRFADAIDVLERGMALRRDVSPRFSPQLAGLLGAAYTATGRLNDGIALLEAAVDEKVPVGVGAFDAMVLNWLAESYLASGRDVDAFRVAEEAFAVAQEQGARGEAARNCRLFGEIRSRPLHFDPGASESQFRSGLALADELGMRPLMAHCHVGLGELYAKIGKHVEARVELTAAVDLYRTMELTFWLPRAESALENLT